jgi:hypothetical protein
MPDKLCRYLGQSEDVLEYATSDKLINNSKSIGVELELESIPVSRSGYNSLFEETAGSLWDKITDSSLRDGAEFIFKRPLKGKNIINAINKFDVFIREYELSYQEITLSDRCSTHIHLDMREETAETICNLVLFYILFERVLFEQVDYFRRKNNFCRPLTDSTFIDLFRENFVNKDLGTILTSISNNGEKYSALNLLPLNNYGSVEFRHKDGCKNMEDLLKWINIILSLYNLSTSYKIEDVLEQIKSSTDKEDLLSGWFNGLLSFGMYDLNKELQKGVNDVVSIISFNEFINRNVNTSRSTKRTLLERREVLISGIDDLSLAA